MADQEEKKASLSTGIRVVGAFIFASILGLLILFYEVGFINIPGVPWWIFPYIILPLIAYSSSFGILAVLQQLSCGKVQFDTLAMRSGFAILPVFLTPLVLYYISILRWPVEGLMQGQAPNIRRGFSSAFFMFWGGLYTQELLNSLSQFCPN